MSECWAVIGLFWSSLLGATLLPGGSEIALVSLLLAESAGAVTLVVVATPGITLGGIINVIIGRLLPRPQQRKGYPLAMRWLQCYGAAALLFSWMPLIGDVLCLAAGWLRMPWVSAVLFIGIGKALRYVLLAGITLQGGTAWL